MAAEILARMQELKQLIIHNLDIEELMDILGMDMADLVEKLEEEIEENFDELMEAVQ